MKTSSSFLSWLLMQRSKQAISPQPWLQLSFFYWFIQISLKQSGILFLPPVLLPSPQTQSRETGCVLWEQVETKAGKDQEKQKCCCFTCWTSEHFEINFDSLFFKEKQGRFWFVWKGKSLPLQAPYEDYKNHWLLYETVKINFINF